MRVEFVPYPAHESQLESCKAHVGAALDRGGIGCILVEPILGRGGCIVPPAGFLPMLREACDAAGVLLVADEIWTGLGRSGAMLASVDAGVVPDLVCLGKGLGSGLPISACIGRGRAFAAWGAHGGSAIHTATHFGAPIACAAALATLDALASEKLVTRAREVGERWTLALLDQLRERRVAQVRGRGMMIGVEVEGGAARALAASRALLSRGYLVLTGGTKGDVLTLTPPLNIDEPLLGAFASALAECLN
jgi:4-aminobutyrate aminotransferase/(S)-3-amino-2-methylpropionate transaminase